MRANGVRGEPDTVTRGPGRPGVPRAARRGEESSCRLPLLPESCPRFESAVEAEQRQRDETGEAGAMCLRGECDAERVTRIERRLTGGPAAVLTLPLLDCSEFRIFEKVSSSRVTGLRARNSWQSRSVRRRCISY